MQNTCRCHSRSAVLEAWISYIYWQRESLYNGVGDVEIDNVRMAPVVLWRVPKVTLWRDLHEGCPSMDRYSWSIKSCNCSDSLRNDMFVCVCGLQLENPGQPDECKVSAQRNQVSQLWWLVYSWQSLHSFHREPTRCCYWSFLVDREKGGAYGGRATGGEPGLFHFFSYR